MKLGLLKIGLVVAVAAAFAGAYLPTSTAQIRGRFSHTEPKHQTKTCAQCHMMPTPNWVAARGFPDVAQFPGHASCFTCHTSAVLMGAKIGGKPAFCLGCHSNVAPGRAPFLAFPVASRPREFNIRFPHNVHQDILARLEPRTDIAVAHYVNATWAPSTADEKKAAFNSCAVCHVQRVKLPAHVDTPPIKDELKADMTAASEKVDTTAAYFKTMPAGHQTCFTCHYSGIKPAANECAGCHTLTKPYQPTETLHRYSVKFDHTQKDHAGKDCMACHVRIAQNSDAAAMKDPDVPILACAACHGDPFNGAKKGANNYSVSAIANELTERQKDKTMQCTYCHSTAVGRYPVPASHLAVKK
jgi:hypothetical protein